MSLPAQYAAQLVAFPSVLRELVEAELAAGNTIVEVASCFPAPPAGAYVKLAKSITTRPRAKTAALDFYDRNTSIYSGEWTDARRFYFVIEPPRPPPAEVDMNAIRDARSPNAGTRQHSENKSSRSAAGLSAPDSPAAPSSSSRSMPGPKSIAQRFRDSMVIDYEKWHDGIGYEVELLPQATPAELKVIEDLLLSRGASDWRDIEALAALKTGPARQALKMAMIRGNAEIRGAVIRHAPDLVCADDKTTFLIEALRTANFYGGLSQALDLVAVYHPPEVVAELFRGVLERAGDVAIHFAAMLMFIHGEAKQPFDWEQRPFFLRFDASTRAERELVFRELCKKIGANADEYLREGGLGRSGL